MPLLALIMLFAALGGIASAAFAVVFLWVPEERAARVLPHFVSFATGALLGAALLALLPEAMQGAGTAGAHRIGLTLVVGLGVFFVIEKLVLWWHAHAHDEGAGLDHADHGMPAAITPVTITRATAPPACWCWSATASTMRSMAC